MYVRCPGSVRAVSGRCVGIVLRYHGTMQQHADTSLETFLKTVRPVFEERLSRLVAVPTVSADAAYADDIRRGADLACSILQEAGCTARIMDTSGKPVVYGELMVDDDAPTVLIYNHMDVQPADAADWRTDPFRLQVQDGVYFGRGATDDKGPALTVLAAAEYAKRLDTPLNIKLVWEFEEEIGSPHFAAFVQAHKGLLRADSVVVSDSVWISRDRPAIDYGLRGLVTFELSLRTADKDVHSGLAGGVARNPLGELMQLIGQCYDARTGSVLIPGFYDAVTPPGEDEMASFMQAGFDPASFRAAHGLRRVRTTDTAQMLERIMARPTFEVHGVTGGYDGPGVKTVIPHAASVKASCRLVAGQEPEAVTRLIRSFVHRQNPDVEFRLDATAAPFLGDFSGPYADAARKAVLAGFGISPSFIREGGTIGAVLALQQVLGAPIVLLGLSLPEHGYHAVDEHFDWRQAEGGIRTFVNYFQEISAIPHDPA